MNGVMDGGVRPDEESRREVMGGGRVSQATWNAKRVQRT